MSFEYKNPNSSVILSGPNSVGIDSNTGTNFSIYQVGGFCEVFSLDDLKFNIPSGSTGTILFSKNIIPIDFSYNAPNGAPNVINLYSDGVSSGRRKLGMVAYVYENNKTYQYNIPNYQTLFDNAVVAGSLVDIGTGYQCDDTTLDGRAFVNAWTGSTIEGISGVTRENARWVEYNPEIYLTGGTYNSGNTILYLYDNVGNTIEVTGFTVSVSGATGSSGTSGVDGTSGVQGSSGETGSSGTSGSSGGTGSSGASGSSGTSGSAIDELVISGTQNNVNRTFTISEFVDVNNHLFFYNGQLQQYGVDYDILSGTTLVIDSANTPPTPNCILKIYGGVVIGVNGTSGTSGSSGSSGSSGTSGSSGSSGSSGTSGTEGTSGSSGSSGTSGSSGSSGSSGTSGTEGTSGSSGSSGTSGTTGTSGTSGAQGISAGQVYYLNESQNSDVSGYKTLSTMPLATTQQSLVTSVPGNSTGTLVSDYITPELGFSVIPGGVQKFHLHFLKTNQNDEIDVYVEIQLANFSGQTIGPSRTSNIALIDWLDGVTPVEENVDITIPTTTIDPTNRMIVRIYLNNQQGSTTNVTFYTEGNSNYSFVLTSVGAIAGSSGTSGTSGSAGTSGTEGTSGTSGSSGTSGGTGSSGASGSSGTSGTEGTSGSSGSSGTSGGTGSSGATGSSGTSGTSGSPLSELTLSGDKNGVNRIFTTTTTINEVNHLFFINGVLMAYNDDYTLSGSQITINSEIIAPDSTDILKLYNSVVFVSGTSGTSGSSGTSGGTGSSGASGSSGISGSSGASGSSGTSALITSSETRPSPINTDQMCLWYDTTNKMPMVSYCINTSLPGAWSAGGAMITGRYHLGLAGTQNTGLAIGGYFPVMSCTEEYNGTSWSVGGTLIIARAAYVGMGSQNAALSAGGYSTGARIGCTEEYDGTSWSAGGALMVGRSNSAGGGSQNSAFLAAGNTGTFVSCTEEYNGTSWSAGGTLITARWQVGGIGTQNSGLTIGGFTNTEVSCTEEYNGTSWSAGGALILARKGLAGAGSQNEGLVTGGLTNAGVACTEEYNGTSWSVGGALIVLRSYMDGSGTQNAGLVAGGLTNAGVACTEEYNAPTEVVDRSVDSSYVTAQYPNRPEILETGMCLWFDTNTRKPMVSYYGYGAGVWSAGGALITALYGSAGAGTQNEGLIAGGYTNAVVACTEEYNGTSWSAGGALITARYVLAGAGTQNAGLVAAGLSNAGVACTEEYNGTAWTAGGALITARFGSAGAGTQNEAFVAGGYVNAAVSCTEEYNGTSWSVGGVLITTRYYFGGAGTQNEGLIAGGYTGGAVSCTEEYNGTSWSAGGGLIIARYLLAGAGTQNAGLFFGGYPSSRPGVTCTEEYNGTSWLAGGALAIGRYGSAAVGSQSAGLVTGGFTNTSAISSTEEYNKPLQIFDCFL